MKNKERNVQINKLQEKLKQVGDYEKFVEALLPLVKLAEGHAVKADIDNGEDKKTWRMIHADVVTIKSMVEDVYSDIADRIHELSLEKYTEEL